MGWGNKAIEIRSAETGHLDGVFMHKRSQQLRFLCERNDKVSGEGGVLCRDVIGRDRSPRQRVHAQMQPATRVPL